ncbi:MAG: bifunctional RNase H/acid phosphatase [Actinomycetota bacterium]|nr:bifunctional RNase H/acid phosphatase [Actinomycetota bacterium]
MTAVGGPRLIVEADGGSRGNPGPAGYGALVRDPVTGQILAERGESIGRATNNVAEYRGLIAGLEAVIDFEPSVVEVRMDSKLVVEQMSGRWKIKHADLQPLALQARRLAQLLPTVTYTWIPREQNGAADRLANQALDGVPIGALNPSAKRARRGESAADPGSPQALPQTVDPSPTAQPSLADLRMDAPVRLFLLRHGVTVHTPERRFSGRNDLVLTEDGRIQISAAAARLAALGSTRAVLSSPLPRARESAQIVADALHLTVEVDHDLIELDFGDFEAMTWADAHSAHPAQLSAFRSSPDIAAPGGESIAAVGTRVDRVLSRLRTEYTGCDVVVVTHLTPIKVLLCRALNVELSTVHRFFLGPASLSIVDWYADGRASVTLVNDTSHWEGR